MYITEGKQLKGTKAILYDDRSGWRNSFSVSPNAVANFADRSDWRIKSSISSVLNTSD